MNPNDGDDETGIELDAGTVDDLDSDLRSRWTPTAAQDSAAHEALSAGETAVYTAHLLVNKEYGWWRADVEVVALPGIFGDRDEASAAIMDAARSKHAETGLPVTGGYTWHRLAEDGETPRSAGGVKWQTMWAVFEDILAVFPEPSWRKK